MAAAEAEVGMAAAEAEVAGTAPAAEVAMCLGMGMATREGAALVRIMPVADVAAEATIRLLPLSRARQCRSTETIGKAEARRRAPPVTAAPGVTMAAAAAVTAVGVDAGVGGTEIAAAVAAAVAVAMAAAEAAAVAAAVAAAKPTKHEDKTRKNKKLNKRPTRRRAQSQIVGCMYCVLMPSKPPSKCFALCASMKAARPARPT